MFDVIVGKPDSGLVVNMEWCCRLGVVEFSKGGSHGAGLLGDEEGCPNFCFHGGSHGILHDFYQSVNHAIGWIIFGFVSEIEHASSTSASVGF